MTQQFQVQEILNRVFDSTNNKLNIAMPATVDCAVTFNGAVTFTDCVNFCSATVSGLSLADPTTIGSLSLGSGSITDTCGAISFGNENLSTTGSMTANTFSGGGACVTCVTAVAVPVGGITGLGSDVATWLATPSSANLADAVTDETGSGALVFGTSPTFTTSILLADETVDIGTASVGLNDLHFGSGGIINFDGGDVTLTHTACTVTLAGGNLVMSSDNHIDFACTAPGTSGDSTGIVYSFTAGAALSQGCVVYINTSGKMAKADADATTSMPAIGVATAAACACATVNVLTHGIMKLTGWSFTAGDDVYVSLTAGGVTGTAPSSSCDVVQKIGVAVASDTIFFNFNTTEIVVA